jgi:GTP-binding protein
VLPAIALVGRPNVGKSTLFNRLTGTRDALVADFPGLTRDRLYGYCRAGSDSAIIIDTGGLSGDQDEMSLLMARQVELAVAEADVVVFLVEATVGIAAGDEEITRLLRRSGKQVLLAVNKAEGLPAAETAAEFWSLGLGEPHVVSAARGDRVNDLLAAALALCPPDTDGAAAAVPSGTRIAVVG